MKHYLLIGSYSKFDTKRQLALFADESDARKAKDALNAHSSIEPNRDDYEEYDEWLLCHNKWMEDVPKHGHKFCKYHEVMSMELIEKGEEL